jgi:dimethylargininase
VLATFRPIVSLTDPATLDGGDVLLLGRVLYVGTGTRTNSDGIMQLADAVQPFGYEVRSVETRDALHLKSAVTEVADGVVLANPSWVDPSVFDDVEVIEVDPEEPFAANALRLGDRIIHSTGFPRTGHRLVRRGLQVSAIDASELAKAEGGVTCCSLLLNRT